jgi:hypothetical protein
MIRWAADENLDNNIVRALQRRQPDFDIVRVQDVGLSGADDPAVLRWCADERRILITHDKAMVPAHAYDRVTAGALMPGVIIVPIDMSTGLAADDLVLVDRYSEPEEWEERVVYLPL